MTYDRILRKARKKTRATNTGGEKMSKNKYWYKITYVECPMCGKSTEYRERQYTPKPEDFRERISYEDDTSCANYDLLTM